MGKCLGISSNYVYMIEAGRTLPSPNVLHRFSAHFGFNFYLTRIILLRDKIEEYTEEVKKKLNLEDLP